MIWRPRRMVRAAASTRHRHLRAFAAEAGWSVVGLVNTVTADMFVQGSLTASELAISGERDGWTITVALVASRADSGRPRQTTALVSVLDFGTDGRSFVARRPQRALELESSEVDVDRELVRRVLDAENGLLRADSVALSDLQLVHVHRLSQGSGALPVEQSVSLVVALANALSAERR